MLTGHSRHRLRRLGRALAVSPAVVTVLVASPVAAETPERWPEAEPVSTLSVLLLYVGAPLALFAIITLLVYVPSMARGERYTPGLAWHNKNEWFGGPHGGVEATEVVDRPVLEGGSEGRTGGAGARW